jgi:hypothetical protein
MIYIKLFDNFNPNHYVPPGIEPNSEDELDKGLSDGMDAILAPITDDGYHYNYYIFEADRIQNDKKRLEVSIYVEGSNSFDEGKLNFIKGSEIKEAVLTLVDFLKRRTGNEPSIYVWDDSEYQFIDMKDTDTHGLEDLDDLKEEYAETDTIKIVVLLDT